MLHTTLESIGFSDKQAKVYLAALQAGTASVSTIARIGGINRITCYNTLKELIVIGYAQETLKNNIKHFSVMDPISLVGQYEDKYRKIQEQLPAFVWLMQGARNKPKIAMYEWIDQLKRLFMQIIEESVHMPKGTPFLTFLGTQEIDNNFHQWLVNEFVPLRLQEKRKTRSIIANDTSYYNQYTKDYHEYIIVDQPTFAMRNEIVIYGNSKVAILLYSKDEMSGIVIDSQSLHDSLTHIFGLVRNTNKFLRN